MKILVVVWGLITSAESSMLITPAEIEGEQGPGTWPLFDWENPLNVHQCSGDACCSHTGEESAPGYWFAKFRDGNLHYVSKVKLWNRAGTYAAQGYRLNNACIRFTTDGTKPSDADPSQSENPCDAYLPAAVEFPTEVVIDRWITGMMFITTYGSGDFFFSICGIEIYEIPATTTIYSDKETHCNPVDVEQKLEWTQLHADYRRKFEDRANAVLANAGYDVDQVILELTKFVKTGAEAADVPGATSLLPRGDQRDSDKVVTQEEDDEDVRESGFEPTTSANLTGAYPELRGLRAEPGYEQVDMRSMWSGTGRDCNSGCIYTNIKKYTKAKREQRDTGEEKNIASLQAKIARAQRELKQLGEVGRNHVKGKKLAEQLAEDEARLAKLERTYGRRLNANKLSADVFFSLGRMVF
eukprot:g12764.t1